MKRVLFVALLYSLNVFPQENNKGFDLSAKYTGDYAVLNNNDYTNFSVYLGNIDLIMTFNTENAQLWKGGLFSVYMLNNHGNRPSEQYIGDMQVFSNIEAPERTKLYELWYEQTIGEKFSIKVGQQNINSEFVCSDLGTNFINSSFGTMPSVACNFPLSMFPNTAIGARVMYTINDAWRIQGALFDGEPGDEKTNKYGAKWSISKHEGADILTELHYTLKNGNAEKGNYKLGYWYHTGNFTDIKDTLKNHTGNWGTYLLADHVLFSEQSDDKQGLGVFVILGIASKSENFVNYGFCGGLSYSGLFNGRDEDILGIGFTNATINSDFVKANSVMNSENVIELTYSAKINDFISLQPDFQYIINPGGAKNNNAFIALLRFGVEF